MTPRTSACILGCAGPVLDPAEARFFARVHPWGFILFARNVETPGQLRKLCADLRAAVGWHAPILIDQEGGRVERMTEPHWRSWPPPLDQVDRLSPDDAARAFWVRGRGIALDLSDAGIDVTCAPLADVACAETHPVLKNRCYGRDPATVARHARAMAEGLLAGGVLPVLKHLPGYGRGTVDSHKDLPRASASAEVLRAVDFAPFAELRDIRMGMTAHLVYEAFDPGRPATVSPRMIDLIRREIGFDGLLMTDDISMEALSGTVAERGQAALAAGCDLVLHCNGEMPDMEALCAAVPPMTEAAQERAAAALAQRHAPEPIDIPALDAERDALNPLT